MRKKWTVAFFRASFLAGFFLLAGLIMWMMITGTGGVAWAKEPATPELTLQQAIEKALAISKSLKNAEYEVERTEEVRDSAADRVEFIPAPQSNPDPVAAANFTGMVSADLQWQMAKKSYALTEDIVTAAVTSAYYSVLQAQENVRVAEMGLQQAQLARNAALASYRVGMLSKTGLNQAESGLTAAKSALEAAQKGLDDAYQQFNQLVGLWPEDRPVLTDRPSYSVLAIDSLDTEVEKAVENSPALWLAKRNVDLAKLQLDLYSFNNETEPYKSKEIKVDQAELSAAGKEETLRNSVRSTYNKIRQLEESYAALQQDLAVKEENLRVVQLKFDLGMVTKTDLLAARVELAKAQKSLLDAVCQHELLKIQFAKPWVSGGSS